LLERIKDLIPYIIGELLRACLNFMIEVNESKFYSE